MRSSLKVLLSQDPQLLWGDEAPTELPVATLHQGLAAVHQGQGVQVVEHEAAAGDQRVLGQCLGQVAGVAHDQHAQGAGVQEVEDGQVAQGQLQPVLPQAAVLGEIQRRLQVAQGA